MSAYVLPGWGVHRSVGLFLALYPNIASMGAGAGGKSVAYLSGIGKGHIVWVSRLLKSPDVGALYTPFISLKILRYVRLHILVGLHTLTIRAFAWKLGI